MAWGALKNRISWPRLKKVRERAIQIPGAGAPQRKQHELRLGVRGPREGQRPMAEADTGKGKERQTEVREGKYGTSGPVRIWL